jgi:catalase
MFKLKSKRLSFAATATLFASLSVLTLSAVAQTSTDIKDPDHLNLRTPAQLVADLHSAFGDHHVRAVHAKGLILEGRFTPSADARSLSYASVFLAPIPVIVRFSDFTGIPDIPDTEHLANPRGFAVKFLLPDGSNYDVVNHSFNGFPVSSSAEFSVLLQAIAASGPTAPKPTPLDRYLDTHPYAKSFLTTQKPAPESWATTGFYGVNAVEFTNAKGQSRFVRYRFVPVAGEHYLDDASAHAKAANYLNDEIRPRLASGPVSFVWYAQLSVPGDNVENPAVAWPESRKLVKLGVITIDRLASQTGNADKSLSFLPGTMPPGIGIADPMLAIRNAAYPISYHQRQ